MIFSFPTSTLSCFHLYNSGDSTDMLTNPTLTLDLNNEVKTLNSFRFKTTGWHGSLWR